MAIVDPVTAGRHGDAARSRAPQPYWTSPWPLRLVAISGAAAVVAFAVTVATDLYAWRVIGAMESSPDAVPVDVMRRADDVRCAAAAAAFVTLLAVVGSLAAWSRQAYVNAAILRPTGLRYSPGWAAGGWFVPFLNVVRPKQVVDDLWRASTTNPTDREDRAGAVFINVWWGLWLLGALVLFVSGDVTDGDDFTEARVRLAVEIAGLSIGAVSVVLGMIVAAWISARQRRQAAIRGLVRARSDVSAWSALVSIVVTGACFVAGGVYAGLSSELEPDEPAVADDEGPESTSVFVNALEVGDCFDSTALARGLETEEFVELAVVAVIDCSDPHEFEVYAEVSHPASDDAEYPGDVELGEYAYDHCFDEFEPAIGRDYPESVLDFTVLTPIAEGWRDGDRSVQCLAMRVDGQQLTQDVIGSGM